MKLKLKKLQEMVLQRFLVLHDVANHTKSQPKSIHKKVENLGVKKGAFSKMVSGQNYAQQHHSLLFAKC